MRERVCKNCGGREYQVVGQNMLRCKFCGTLYVDEHSSKEEEVLIVGANEILRAMQFEQAEEEFDKILEMFPLSFEAHFGKALAKNRIVIYKKGQSKRPRFFNGIVSISNDENFKKAVELAPPDMNYQTIAKRVDKILTAYEHTFSKEQYDCIICAKADDENALALAQNLKEMNKNPFVLPEKDKEEQTYRALETAKALILFLNETGLTEFRHVCDRYLSFVQQRKKTRSSVIVVCDTTKIPKELSFCRKFDTTESDFMQELTTCVAKEIDRSVNEIAKIEAVKVEKVEPNKKEYVDIETVEPIDVGNYKVENQSASDETKIKWIYLSLKNGDFQTAKEQISQCDDPYDSRLLFAQLLAEKEISTREQFFADIENFNEKEKIDDILRYANREFAQNFVDDWEKLVEKLQDVEIYQTFLTYLASFKTPNRENFVKAAEELAIQTMNAKLIDDVLKCFDKTDVERFVNFYFSLAQSSDDKTYYEKILEIDPGHFESNLALYIQKIQPSQKIAHDDVENIIKFFDENQRNQFLSAAIEQILEMSFFDVTWAQEQIDFHLSYFSQDTKLAAVCKDIAEHFQQMRFFKVAEKYLAIAISKDKRNAELFWLLILIRAHCRSDNELITSSVKVTQMPEWETVLAVGDDAEDEKYTAIVSKANLYKGERQPFLADLMDRKDFAAALKEFLMRCNKTLLEAEKENNIKGGIRYYQSQLEPFEKHLQDLEKVSTFQEYVDLVDKVQDRLDALDLSLDHSLSMIKISGISTGMNKLQQEDSKQHKKVEQIAQKAKRKQILKRFLLVFFEFFPLLLATFLFAFMIFAPKEVYLNFGQNFLIWAMFVSAGLALANGTLFFVKKKSGGWKLKTILLSVFGIGIVNVVLFVVGFYFSPKQIEISSASDLQTLLNNAYYADFVLEKDIDFKGKAFENKNFYGTFDGKGHTISNIALSNGGLFRQNSGVVKNLNLELSEKTYHNAIFGALAKTNSGKILNCSVSGKVVFELQNDAHIGGLVGENNGGEVSNCKCTLEIELHTENGALTFGGIVGVSGSSDDAKLFGNISKVDAQIEAKNSQNLVVGAIAGSVQSKTCSISQNVGDFNLKILGDAQNVLVGGLVGELKSSISNSHVCFGFEADEEISNGFVGGLVGSFDNSESLKGVEFSYSEISNLTTTLTQGTLIGRLKGRARNCFSTLMGEFCGQVASYGGCINCMFTTEYDNALEFDESVWNFAEEALPKLKFEE